MRRFIARLIGVALLALASITGALAGERVLPPATADDVGPTLGFPVFVKDPCGGSSLEVRPARDPAELRRAVSELGSRRLLVEAAVAGRELTVPVLDDGEYCKTPGLKSSRSMPV